MVSRWLLRWSLTRFRRLISEYLESTYKPRSTLLQDAQDRGISAKHVHRRTNISDGPSALRKDFDTTENKPMSIWVCYSLYMHVEIMIRLIDASPLREACAGGIQNPSSFKKPRIPPFTVVCVIKAAVLLLTPTSSGST